MRGLAALMSGHETEIKCCQVSQFPYGRSQELPDYSTLTPEGIVGLSVDG